MTDIHCHLNFKSFTDDYENVIKKANADGVNRIINVGTSIESSDWAVELAEKFENLYAIVGIHPHHSDKVQHNWIGKIEKLLDNPKVLGIGEIGMDYYEYKSNGIVEPKAQEKVFRLQIELALKHKLPLQIHNRQAGEDVIRILSDYKKDFQDPPGMFHCFASTKEVLKNAIDMGFYFGFDGNTTYKGIAKGETEKLSDLIKLIPIDRLVVETDSPYLTPEPLRGSRNTPSNVIITGKFIAKLKSIPFESFEEITDANVNKIFKKIK